MIQRNPVRWEGGRWRSTQSTRSSPKRARAQPPTPIAKPIPPPLFTPGELPIGRGALAGESTRGIITGGNKDHWQCLGALAIGADRFGLGLAVADHGLEGWQRAELVRVGARMVDHQQPRLNQALKSPGVVVDIRAWWKPWICLASPFKRSMWIDADAVLVSDPIETFDGSEMMMSMERAFRTDIDELHSRLVQTFFGTERGYEDLLRVNTGVFAFDQNDPWIWEWAAWCGRLTVDDELVKLATVRDQSAAFLSLINRRRMDIPMIEFLSEEWNVSADYQTAFTSGKQRALVPADPGEFFEVAIKRHPGAKVVHWLGCGKPWNLIEKQDPFQFTRDFVTENTDNWSEWLKEFIGKPHAALEIGSFEGRSAIWFANNILTHPGARLTCVDPFTWLDARDRFWSNIRAAGVGSRLNVLEKDSLTLKLDPNSLSWAYIDGKHDTEYVLWDAVSTWRALKPGGVLIFDDYMYQHEVSKVFTVRIAVDAFMKTEEGGFEVMSEPDDYQMCLRKL